MGTYQIRLSPEPERDEALISSNSEKSWTPAPSDAMTVALAPFDVPSYNFEKLDALCDAIDAAASAACFEMEEIVAWRKGKSNTSNGPAASLPPWKNTPGVRRSDDLPHDEFLECDETSRAGIIEAQVFTAMFDLSKEL